jgi:carotenoid cleavage dioxygenase
MVAGVYVRDGKVSYRARWAETDTMKVELAAGEAVYSGFVNGGTPGRLPDGAPPTKNVANTNVGVFGDELIVYYEGALPTTMHPGTLATGTPYDFHGGIDVLCTAHYKIDPATGDMLFFAALGPRITWYRADVTTGAIVDSATLDTGVPVMMHDFAVTESHAVFFVTPAHSRLDLIMQGRPGLVWDEAAMPHGTSIVLLDRTTHAVSWHEVGGQFANTHFYNAYELDGRLVVEGHRIARLGTPVDRLGTPVPPHEWFPPAWPHRWTIDLATGRVGDEQVSGVAGAFPKINDAYTGKAHRYGYMVTTRGLAPDQMSDGLAKHDALLDRTIIVEGPDDLTSPSEPVFVPRESAATEDDGYLLSIWWNRSTQLSEFLVHDAAGLQRTPLARVPLPARLPFGFHGSWVDAAVLDRAIVAQRAGSS